MSRRPSPFSSKAFRAAAVFFGIAMAAAGALVLAVALGLIPGRGLNSAGSGQAFALLVGTVFLSGGLAATAAPFVPRLAANLGGVALLAFVAAFNWIAFGPGERQFTRRVGVGTTAATQATTGQASEAEGRLVFGIAAGGLDALLLAGLYRALRGRLHARKPQAPKENPRA